MPNNIPMVDDNGKIRPMTAAEEAALNRFAAELPTPEPTPEERRMDEIEMALMELAEMLAGGGL